MTEPTIESGPCCPRPQELRSQSGRKIVRRLRKRNGVAHPARARFPLPQLAGEAHHVMATDLRFRSDLRVEVTQAFGRVSFTQEADVLRASLWRRHLGICSRLLGKLIKSGSNDAGQLAMLSREAARAGDAMATAIRALELDKPRETAILEAWASAPVEALAASVTHAEPERPECQAEPGGCDTHDPGGPAAADRPGDAGDRPISLSAATNGPAPAEADRPEDDEGDDEGEDGG